MKKIRNILMWSIAAIPLLTAATLPDNEARRKAEYYFMSGAGYTDSASNEHAGYDGRAVMMQRAYELDTTLTEAGYQTATCLIDVVGNDSNSVKPYLRMLEQHFAKHPDDIYAGSGLANAYFYYMRNSNAALQTYRTLSRYNSEESRVLLHRASLEMQFGSTDSAMMLFDDVERIEGKSLQITSRRLQCLHERNDTVGILSLMARTRSEMPQSATARVLSATVFDMYEMPDSANAMIDEAIALDPNDVDAHRFRLAQLAENNDMAGYISELNAMIDIDDVEYADRLNLIVEFYNDFAKVDPAITHDEFPTLLQRLITRVPSETDAYVLLGSFLKLDSLYADAADVYEEASTINPGAVGLRVQCLSTLLLAKEYSRAITYAERATADFPDEITLLMLKGNAYQLNGDTQKALQIYVDGLSIATDDNNRSDLYQVIGDLYHETGDTAQSFQSYEHSLKLAPDNSLTLNNYAYFLAISGGNLDTAERMSARALMLESDSPTLLDTMAWIKFLKKDYSAAREYIDAALRTSTDNAITNMAELYHHAGDIYFMAGIPEQAVNFWETALQSDPNNELLQRKVKNRTFFYE